MFYFSLPIIFIDLRLISPAESFLILCMSFAALFFTLPKPEAAPRVAGNVNYLLNAWMGYATLANVFWPFFLLLNGSLILADFLAKGGQLTVSSWDDIHFVLILPYIWWAVSVWRCSAHENGRIWRALARLTTLLVLVEYGFKLLIRVDYPRLFFNCEDLLLNYGNCF